MLSAGESGRAVRRIAATVCEHLTFQLAEGVPECA